MEVEPKVLSKEFKKKGKKLCLVSVDVIDVSIGMTLLEGFI